MEQNKNHNKEKKQHVKNNSEIQNRNRGKNVEKWQDKEENDQNDFTENKNSRKQRKRPGKTVKKLPGKSTTPKIRNQGKNSRNEQGKNNVILREMPRFPST